MCRVLEFGPDQGLQGQVVDIVRMLLDPDSMEQSPEKDPFLELFYDKYAGELINLLIEGAEQNQQQNQERLDAFRRQEQVCLPLLDTTVVQGLGTKGRDKHVRGGSSLLPMMYLHSLLLCSPHSHAAILFLTLQWRKARSADSVLEQAGRQTTRAYLEQAPDPNPCHLYGDRSLCSAEQQLTAARLVLGDTKSQVWLLQAGVKGEGAGLGPGSEQQQQEQQEKQAEVKAKHIGSNTMGMVLDLLCFCVQHHGYR